MEAYSKWQYSFGNVRFGGTLYWFYPKTRQKSQILPCNVHIPASEQNAAHFVKSYNIQIS